MICTVDVDIQAANPDFPLKEWKAFKGSPTSLRIRNVPRRVGAWDITEVNVKCVYPDNTAHMVAAVLTGCVWVATIPASDAVGFVEGGYSIEADGTDERGNIVTGYRLGEGKVTIKDIAVSAHAAGGVEFVRVMDTKSDEPRKGDFALDTMEIFGGAAWRTLVQTHDIGDLTRIEPYLYELNNAVLDDAFAEGYFRECFQAVPPPAPGAASPNPSPLGACSCVRIGNEFARAYDWRYNGSVSFLVRTKSSGTRFASVAVCASPDGLTRQAVESKTAAASLFRAVPFYALDGINENGVTCCVNVVAANADGAAAWPGRDFCAVGAVRRVLDHARTAEEGAHIIRDGAWMPSGSKMGGYALHFMVADKDSTYIVEDGIVFEMTDDDVKAMTNFRVGGYDFLDDDGNADVNKIAAYDQYGTGAERYNALTYIAKTPVTESLREWLTAFKYSDAYAFADTPRPSDFAGIEIAPGVRAKINDTLKIEDWFVANDIHAKWLARTRDGTFWQTVHSSVYNIAARSLQLVVQEGDAVHTFPLVKSESEPADYPTVRTNAATGAAHAAETDNPHATTAEQVGVRVVELVVEGDAKKLYLMLNGERTTERVTSYAALLAMAKRGLVRLYYNAVGGTGRKALYTAHMVDDAEDQPPTMRFDATGTLGEKVYTRSIAMTKSGEDGIAVSIGTLTEIQKALTPGQIANIEDVAYKVAKDDVVAPDDRAINGEAADARETFLALMDRRDRTDNICATDSVGLWSIPAPIIINGVTHTFDETQPTRKDGYLKLDHWLWTDNQGGRWFGPDDEKATDGIFYSAEFALYSFSSSCATVAKEGESYVTPTGVGNLIPKLTTTIAETETGKAAEAAAVARLLSGITAQDIEDFLKKFKGVQYDYDSFHFACSADDWFVVNVDGGINCYIAAEAIEAGSEWDLAKTRDPSEGLEKLLSLSGTDNKYLGQTITTLAEAACRYKVVAADKDVANRSIKVYDLTQSGASLPSAIPLPDFPTDGVIDCEVWIVAGETAPTDVTYGKTIYPRGGEGLTYEANATTIVHLTAVAGQNYYTAVAASFKAQA